jgi:molybdate transport system substrate-binding protein
MMTRLISAALAAILASTIQAPAPTVLIFAASSLKTALDAMAEPIRQTTGVTIKVSYASSAVLARQIEEGAPAGMFISADADWMDYVDTRGLIKKDTRVNLLGNELVLVAPAGQKPAISIAPGFNLAGALGNGRLAIGEPTSVPAGKYAKAALTSLGVWASVEKKLLPAENVRAALTLVSGGDAPLGIVYATDALADRGVTVVGTFPVTTHPPIVYPAALIGRGSAEAAKVLAYLRSAAAMAAFHTFGFSSPK